MGRYLVGSDRSGGNDQGCIDTVCKILKDGGKEAENCGVTPNTEASFRSKGKKDDIGVFIVNGICLGTILSCNDMVKSGICQQVIIGIPKPLMSETFREKESLTDENKKLKLVNDGTNWPSSYRKYEGKYTVDGICNALDGISYAYGETCEELGKNILNGASGTDGTGGGDSSSSDDDKEKEPTPMTYMDMIKDLIKVWDGDVECKIRQNRMYINKVPEPHPQLWIVDGNNITSGSAKVTDYNSDTVNTLNVTYNDGKNTITITDDYLINRFGVVEAETKAEKIVTDYTGDAGTDTEPTTGQEEQGTESLYTQVSKILQENYEKPSEGWNSLTNKVRLAKTGDEIGKLLSAQKKKKGKENKSYTDVRHEIQKIRGMGY